MRDIVFDCTSLDRDRQKREMSDKQAAEKMLKVLEVENELIKPRELYKKLEPFGISETTARRALVHLADIGEISISSKLLVAICT
jgi:DNA-binding transcriptional regulator PaaX